MIPVSPNPVILWIGSLSIRYYGLVYSLGFLFTYWYLSKLSKHKKLSLTIDQIESFLIYSILGTIIGGRVGEFIFYETNILLSNPLQIFKIWQGGMSFHGAIIGIIIAITIFCKKNKVNFYELSDAVVLPGALVLAFGRITNFMNGELLGRISNVSWCVNWFGERNAQGTLVCRHPSQIYESIKNLFIFGILYFMQYTIKGTRKNKKYKPGYLTWIFILLYGILRASVNIWREDNLWFFGILSMGQFLSVIMAIIATIVLITQYNNKKITHKKKRHKK